MAEVLRIKAPAAKEVVDLTEVSIREANLMEGPLRAVPRRRYEH